MKNFITNKKIFITEMEFISCVLATAACQSSGLIELAQEEMTLDGNFVFFNQLRGGDQLRVTCRHLLVEHLPLGPTFLVEKVFGGESVMS